MKITRSRFARATAPLFAAWLLASCAATVEDEAPLVLTIVGSNDVHGQLLPGDGRGGLAAFSGYVEALRATQDASSHAASRGAVARAKRLLVIFMSLLRRPSVRRLRYTPVTKTRTGRRL